MLLNFFMLNTTSMKFENAYWYQNMNVNHHSQSFILLMNEGVNGVY